MKSVIPQIRIFTFIVLVILASVLASAFSISKTNLAKISSIQILGKGKKISLQDAMAKKLISAKFHGIGAAFGDAITVEVKNKTKFHLIIEVIPGTKLISNDKSKQNMVLGKVKGKIVDDTSYIVKALIEIQPKSKGKYILEAYCLESPKKEPTPSTSLKIVEIDTSIQFLIEQGNNLDFSHNTIQAAIYILLENKNDQALKDRIPINNEDLQKARELIELLKRSQQ